MEKQPCQPGLEPLPAAVSPGLLQKAPENEKHPQKQANQNFWLT